MSVKFMYTNDQWTKASYLACFHRIHIKKASTLAVFGRRMAVFHHTDSMSVMAYGFAVNCCKTYTQQPTHLSDSERATACDV